MAFQYKNQAKPAAQRGLEMKMSGQAKGACFNKAVDVAIALFAKGDIMREEIVDAVRYYFEEFKPINMEEELKVEDKKGGPF